jgi:hypothetical protein
MKSQANHNKKTSHFFEKLIRALPGIFSSKAIVKASPVKSYSGLPKLRAGAKNQTNLSDSTWVEAVAYNLASGQTNPLRAKTKQTSETLEHETVEKLLFLFSCLEELTVEFNRHIESIESLKTLRATSARFTAERGNSSDKVPKDKYIRCRVTAGPQSLILRGADGVIEIFQVDSNKVFLPSETEVRKNLKGCFELSAAGHENIWYFDSLPTGDSDQLSFIRKLFRDFLKSAKKANDEQAKSGPATWADNSQRNKR